MSRNPVLEYSPLAETRSQHGSTIGVPRRTARRSEQSASVDDSTTEMIRNIRHEYGPLPLPLIGNLHHIVIGNIKHGGIVELMKRWQKEYGNVITFWFGPIPTVHILDFETAKEEMIVNGAAYVDRYTPYALDVKREGRGTVFSSGDFWADHRRFTLRTLRDFALKNNVMEERIMDEFHYNFGKLEKTMVNGQAKINAGEFFDMLIGSVINRIIFSERFTKENAEEFFEVKHAVDKELMTLSAFGMSLQKWTLNLPLLKNMWRKLIEPQEKLLEFLQKRIDQRFAMLFQ
ncbi:hypothetical protein TELCIR_08351 [Teladorsagia circumcincta]|uniref:Unspecific monooxygenase n=1 Tax=Teladorsagia circumcincta TaxID=45464 RepID=A0A2G9UHU3_TELCI|nr:hypothetical protein TELCIR_08351 [Teladorsagia circumcincta]